MSQFTPRRNADGSVTLEIHMSAEQAQELRRALAEALGDEKPVSKPKAWVALKDRADAPGIVQPKPRLPLTSLLRQGKAK